MSTQLAMVQASVSYGLGITGGSVYQGGKGEAMEKRMKLPMIEALKTAETGKCVQITPRLSVAVEFNKPPELDTVLNHVAMEIRSSAHFEVRQIARDSREIPHLQRQAKRMLMNEVYGPVRERLYEILKMLWESGPSYDDKITKAIDDLVSDLQD